MFLSSSLSSYLLKQVAAVEIFVVFTPPISSSSIILALWDMFVLLQLQVIRLMGQTERLLVITSVQLITSHVGLFV